LLPIIDMEAMMGFNVLPRGNGRRRFLGGLVAGAATAGLGLPVRASVGPAIRVGMTPAFLNDQHALLARWRAYMEEKLGTPVEFIRRDSYRETMDLLRLAKLDFAWICDYPYVYLKDLVRLLVVPLNEGKPYYRSYLIVGAQDKTRNGMADLKGSVFAFADPYSNTGYLAPRYRIREMGEDPATFFRKTFFTWSHRKVVEAVVDGFADAGAIDSFVWESLAKLKPELTGATRIIERSPEYGFPPFVAHRSVSAADFARVQKLLLGMSADPTGKSLLASLNLDGFVVGDRHMYDDVAKMMRAFGEQ
jgi:phosphonate transport system substrate-binding protein